MPENNNVVVKEIGNFEEAGKAIQIVTERVVGLEVRAARKGKVTFPKSWFPLGPPPDSEDSEAEETDETPKEA